MSKPHLRCGISTKVTIFIIRDSETTKKLLYKTKEDRSNAALRLLGLELYYFSTIKSFLKYT